MKRLRMSRWVGAQVQRLLPVLGAGAACLALCTSPALATGTTRFVDGTNGSDGGGANNCQTQASPCATIGQAVSQAGAGDTIQIAPGTYNEAISTALSLSFVGAGTSGPNETLIDSTGLSAPALLLSGAGDSVSDLALETNDAGIGGALNISGSGTVSASGILVMTDSSGNGSDGIALGGSSLTLSDSTIQVTNSDVAIMNTPNTSEVVDDGSGVETTSGTLSIDHSTIETERGMALRIHGSASATTVRDTLLQSSGVEDYTTSETDYQFDQWPVVEMAAGSLDVHASTIHNASVGVITQSPSGGAHTDGIWIPQTTLGAITFTNSILQAQPNSATGNFGADIDAHEGLTASDSSFTTVVATGASGLPSPGTNGNIPGDPGLTDPSSGDFTLLAGSALLGAGSTADDSNGELDLAGSGRTTACPDFVTSLTDVGAYETTAPPCPIALSTGDSTGALTQLSGSENCITGDTSASSGCGTATQPGMTGGSPTDMVQSPDGKSVYVATEDPAGNGVDIAELSRAADGSLSEAGCVEPTGGTAGCAAADAQLLYLVGGSSTPVVEPTRLAISPDGQNLYVDNGAGIAELSRDPTTGALTPLAAADCIAYGNTNTSCTYQNQEQAATAAGMLVSPNGNHLYLATLNQCSFGAFARPLTAPAGVAPTAPGDNQNPNCANNPPQNFAASDLAVFTRDPSTGLLTPSACYTNHNTPQSGCSTHDAGGDLFDGLYWMTSLAMSSDDKYLYVTSQVGAAAAAGNAPFGLLSRDPGEVTELSVDPATGALSQAVGNAACVTAGTGCGAAGDTGQSEVAGAADPQQIVLSPDGLNAYVVGAQYIQTALSGNGALIGSTLTQLARDPSTGVLSPIPGATCFAGYHEACGTAGGPGANVTQIPGLTGAEALAVSPDGQSVYATAQNLGVNSAVVELSRDAVPSDPSFGELTPLSTPNLCLSSGPAPGAGDPLACNSSQPAGLSGGVEPLPGGVLVSSDCRSALVMSDGLAEFARSAPAGNCQSTVGLSEQSLSFNTAPGTTSTAQAVTVTNNGATSLTFEAGALKLAGPDAADFSLTGDTCSGSDVAPSGTCTFSVDFSPGSSGTFTASVQLADNAANSPQSVTLVGHSGTGAVSFSPGSLTFGSNGARIAVSTSQSQVDTVTNSGSASLSFGATAVSGGSAFSVGADTCSGQTLAPGTSCKVTVRYAPSEAGADSGHVSFPDDAPGSPQSLQLSGFAGVPTAQLTPNSLSFDDPGMQTVALKNTSADTHLSIGGISTSGSGAFSQTNRCGSDLAPGASCAISVAFATNSPGTFDGALSVSDDAPGSPQSVPLTAVEVFGGITGTVSDATQTPSVALAGASINACPQVGSGTLGGCQTVKTGVDGSYTLSVPAGSWLLQVSPPASDQATLFGAQAVVKVAKGPAAVQNFDLTRPTPLSGGMSVDGTRSGVPVVTFTQPFNIDVPLHLPATGPPDGVNIFQFVTGISGAGSAGGDTGLDLGMLTMFGVHYDSNGSPDAFGPSLSAQINCTGTPSPCASLLSTTTLDRVSPARDARRRGVDPVAHAAACPPATVNMSIMPGQLNALPTANGVTWVVDWSFGPGNPGSQFTLGTTSTYQPWNFQPPPTDPEFPIASQVIALPGKIVNGAINAPFSAWNTWVTETQTLSTAQRISDPALAQQLNQNAYIDAAVNGLSGAYHGDSQVVQQGLNLLQKANSYNQQSNSALLSGILDCPPKQSSLLIDPSGTVKTSTGIPVAGAKVVLSRSSARRGKQAPVPNGSHIMGPSNRHNPDLTSATGTFHWDVVPGFYQVKADHSGCRSAKGPSLFGLTPVLVVPPPRTNLAITLRCRRLVRAATKLVLRKVTPGAIGGLIEARLLYLRRGRIPAARMPGQVIFTIAGVKPVSVPVDVRHGWALFALPLTRHRIRSLSARFTGNGYLAPSHSRMRSP